MKATQCSRRWGEDQIAAEVCLAASRLQSILCSDGVARPDKGERGTAEEHAVRYVRDRPRRADPS